MSTILLIEDDDTLRNNIALALKGAGYSVLTAENLEKGEQQLNACDLLLLDVLLPDGSGMDFCKRIRDTFQKPIIFLTSCDDENDVVNGFECGADDYIRKPFGLKELFSRIKAVSRRYSVEYDELDLTAAEKKLLEYLMLNKDQFLTRDQILEYIWDSKGIFVNDNTLSVNISRLRDKLKSCGKYGQIVTKRGLGYKWTH